MAKEKKKEASKATGKAGRRSSPWSVRSLSNVRYDQPRKLEERSQHPTANKECPMKKELVSGLRERTQLVLVSRHQSFLLCY